VYRRYQNVPEEEKSHKPCKICLSHVKFCKQRSLKKGARLRKTNRSLSKGSRRAGKSEGREQHGEIAVFAFPQAGMRRLPGVQQRWHSWFDGTLAERWRCPSTAPGAVSGAAGGPGTFTRGAAGGGRGCTVSWW